MSCVIRKYKRLIVRHTLRPFPSLVPAQTGAAGMGRAKHPGPRESQDSAQHCLYPFYSPCGHSQEVLSEVNAALPWLFSIFGGKMLLFLYICLCFLNRFCSLNRFLSRFLLQCQDFAEIKPLTKSSTEQEIHSHRKSCIFNVEGTLC